MICVCILRREHSKAQPKQVLEKPGIEPETPGLQAFEASLRVNDVLQNQLKLRFKV